MGELIRREAASEPRDFSGERLTGAATGQVEIEHYHRYLLAREFCRGRDVLDVAAGEGYGTALLAQVAAGALGVEIDAAVVDAARDAFQKPNLRYEVGDAGALPLGDQSVDVVVSFETLEHLVDQDLFLSEIRRVLRPGGLLVLSTPDRLVYSPPGAAPNPFHARELTRSEFEALLRRHFPQVAVAAQRSMIGSVILGAGSAGPVFSFERRSPALIEGSEGLVRAPYLLALASDAALPPLPDSVYVHRSDLDTDMQVRIEAELGRRAAEAQVAALQQQGSVDGARRQRAEDHAAAQGVALAELEARCAALDSALQDALARCAVQRVAAQHWLEEAGSQERRLAAEMTAHYDAIQRELHLIGRLQAMEANSVWRATAPLRRIVSAVRRRTRLHLPPPTLTVAAPPTVTIEAAAPPMAVIEAPRPAVAAAVIRLPVAAEPLVSVIIPTYGQVEATLACLRAIAAHPPACGIEVVVIDDAYSGPEDLAPLRAVEGINLVRNATNLGYLRSCNQAAAGTRGEFIHLLNNDTVLRPGAIDALVALLQARPDAGLVGSRLLAPDGRLQEAGGIVWDDASAWNYGRDDDPARPEYAYVREADYCSGASIMLRRAVWQALGGYDEAFLPAYYEDVDLAFRVRAHGLKVLYAPASEVVHHEGTSHGTDVTQGVKAAQAANQAVLRARWAATLDRDAFPNGPHLLRARDRARGRTVVLVIDHYVPEPDRDAGSRSTMGIITSLLDAGWVVKFWPDNRAHSPGYTALLEQAGVEVLDYRWPGDLGAWLRANGNEIDHLLAIRPDVAAGMMQHVLRNTGALLSFYGVDLHFARMRRQAELDGDPALHRAADAMERMERRVWRNFDLVLYPTKDETTTARAMAPGVLARGIVPFWFETAPPRAAAPAGRAILFVAGFAHPPNVDAAVFLIDEVIPLLEAAVGPVQVTLAGSNPSPAVRALAGRGVDVTGYVTDPALAALYARHRAVVVPLRFGAGVKGKVIEALSQGVPLVTTGIGAQGVADLAGTVPVHDDAAGLAASLALLLQDDGAWVAQSAAQVAFAAAHFSRAAMGRSVLDAFAALPQTADQGAQRGGDAPGG